MEKIVIRLIVRGRVQGVGYRDWTVRLALRLGLTGWVRNRADGSVEILAAGPLPALEALAAACQEGPPLAAVRGVEWAQAPDEAFAGFEERPTA